MEVSLVEIDLSSRPVLENLFQYYVYDMSGFLALSTNEMGQYNVNHSQLDIYWQRDDHTPFFIYVDSEIAGFALIRRYPTQLSTYDIEQFFVLKAFKGKGVGKKALKLLTTQFSGEWQVRVLVENSDGLQFWLSAITNIVEQEYVLSQELDIDLMMHFIRFTTSEK
ncbi:GNAT family N-acetyltransferase [Vibrio sp. Of7-15]|uniref:GNAT family N-acetyltransferase n=1 Tax=Vibrio sp. Of7-15 TaxID=2724879 RepID=UPI001EF16794|nr:GNAT family N-acetyltransferase [Vibrio sp. Of7-15]MCG7499220.1 GNAT family N-acetyltransferase [Vibrio sp. Of7-15]